MGNEKYYYLGFSQCNGIGPTKFGMLLTHFGSAETAWNAKELDLVASGIGKAAVAKIIDFRKTFSPERYVERMEKLGVTFLTLADESYPVLLKQTEKPPFVLYVKGNKKILVQNDNFLAVVGTRKVTDYGRQVTETLTAELANAGFVIVSGLALGVDAVAHRTTVEVGGKTIAVLGGGVDYCTPRENQFLYNKILESGGAIVSEVPLGYIPHKGSFPSRNRIIAGLSVGVLVTEGAEDSGSLITASIATALHRKVFAVPGPITSSVSRGTNVLITQGAKVVTSTKDVLDELRIKSIKSTKSSKDIKGDSKEEQQIIDLLLTQDLHFDELVRKSGLDSSVVGSLLSLLEMKGLVISHDSSVFGLITS